MQYKSILTNWFSRKIDIHYSSHEVYFKPRQVWMCSLRINIGIEQNGDHENCMRPVLVLKKLNRQQAFIVPITSQHKDNHFFFSFREYSFFTLKSAAALSQPRIVDVKRFVRLMGKIDDDDFSQVQQKLKDLLF